MSASVLLCSSQQSRGASEHQRSQSGFGRRGTPEQVANRVEALFRALHEAAAEGIVDLIAVATQSWPGLTIGAGYEAWRRGAAHFCRLARAITARPTGEITIPQLTGAVDAARTEALIEQDWSLGGRVSLMNFHQTKGREG